MRPKDQGLANRLESGLLAFDAGTRPLPGIQDARQREALVGQLVASIHRVEFVRRLELLDLSDRRTDPQDEIFDPLRAASIHVRRGKPDEAFWLAFLSVHFGMHRVGGWRSLREVYGRLGDGQLWDWEAVSNDPTGFSEWIVANDARLRRTGVPGCFGNHRKYEKLTQTGATVHSYVAWVGAGRTHDDLFHQAVIEAFGDRRSAFDILYRTMRAKVGRFGRLATFDYLTMVSKLGLTDIEPGSAYLHEATGPRSGARLLFGDGHTAREMDRWLAELDLHLGVGMQVLEDALCNWQKRPEAYVAFRG